MAAPLGGCADGGPGAPADDTSPPTEEAGTFDRGDFGIAFDYPEGFAPLPAGEPALPGALTARIGLDDSNLLSVQRFGVNISVTPDKVAAVQPDLDRLFSELAGEPVEGQAVDVGGLPGLEYRFALAQPPGAQSRSTVIFDGPTQYLLTCQSTPEERATVKAACDMALETLRAT